ncbi:hypothetical protein [Komagataeibacter sp. FNDCR2]|nr:hypothetical protein [Komagataeibacter sp. FNDCR2]MCE2575362.1 hypothetical protein [Komagataeibacter sp. FNDCR2]
MADDAGEQVEALDDDYFLKAGFDQPTDRNAGNDRGVWWGRYSSFGIRS